MSSWDQNSKHAAVRHEGHTLTISPTLGPYCQECQIPLFDWPEIREWIKGGAKGPAPTQPEQGLSLRSV